MTTSKSIRLISLLIVLLIVSCGQSEYNKLVREELSKGGRQDSVLLGLTLGQTRKEFMDRCTELNKQQLITMGPRGAVLYYIRDSVNQSSDADLRLLIFPEYDDDGKISNINIEFSYDGWAPWNENYQSSKLESSLLILLKEWYSGNDFIHVKIEDKSVPVKIDGNRRIILKRRDSQTVVAMVQDLTSKKFLGDRF